MSKIERNYEVVATGDICLRAIESSPIDEILLKNKAVIEEIWQEAQERKGRKLFNGTVPNFIRIEKRRDKINVISHFIEYKQFLAQKERPDLKLGIKAIGVSGIVLIDEGKNKSVLFARRGKDVTLYPGFIELVPSGGIDKECVKANGEIDYRSKLLAEFIEETGLPEEYVDKITGFAIVLDLNYNVYDINCEVLLRVGREEVEKNFSSEEYNTPMFISLDDLDNFVKENISVIVPTSMALIEAYRNIK